MENNTIFQVMSITKPFTATGIMILAEEGKLTLRDPIDKHIPEFSSQRVMTLCDPQSKRNELPIRRATIRDLLTHTSGMFDKPPTEINDYNQRMNIPLADLVQIFARQPLLFQPGTQWSYSSPGYDILGHIIELCSNQKYEHFIHDRILNPLGMKDSFFYPSSARLRRIASVYVGSPGGALTCAPASVLGGDPHTYRQSAVYPSPSWGLYSTAEDLFAFCQMMLNGGTHNNYRCLSQFSIQLMTTVHTGVLNPAGWLEGSGFGLGWEVVGKQFSDLVGRSEGTYGHSGTFGTQAWIDPQHKLVRILLAQQADWRGEVRRDDFMALRDGFMMMAAAAAID